MFQTVSRTRVVGVDRGKVLGRSVKLEQTGKQPTSSQEWNCHRPYRDKHELDGVWSLGKYLISLPRLRWPETQNFCYIIAKTHSLSFFPY